VKFQSKALIIPLGKLNFALVQCVMYVCVCHGGWKGVALLHTARKSQLLVFIFLKTDVIYANQDIYGIETHSSACTPHQLHPGRTSSGRFSPPLFDRIKQNRQQLIISSDCAI
jgi:hypothetical protein